MSVCGPAAFSFLNVQSVKNKSFLTKDHVVDINIDILGVTKTWLQPNDADDHFISNLTPTEYSLHHVPRPTRCSGVGVLFKNILDISKSTNSSHQFQSLEFMDMQIRISTTRNILSPASFVKSLLLDQFFSCGI